MSRRFLTALPVYNEQKHVANVLTQVLRYSPQVLVVDDGSTDGTAEELQAFPQVRVVRHAKNRGYGAALLSAFRYAEDHGFETVVTIDCDGQHEPQRIPQFVSAAPEADIISGSRYLRQFSGDSQPPVERQRINKLITAELNRRLGYELTDAFCGFKAYRVDRLANLRLSEAGYAMPLQLWVEAARHGLTVHELAVPLIYLDEKRSFGGVLDDAQTRLQYYHLVLDRSMASVGPLAPEGHLWPGTLIGGGAG